MIDHLKINKVVEYIKTRGFEFETFEVMDSLSEILSSYGFLEPDFSSEEKQLLQEELFNLAEEYEFGEVLYVASQDNFLKTPMLVEVVESQQNPIPEESDYSVSPIEETDATA